MNTVYTDPGIPTILADVNSHWKKKKYFVHPLDSDDASFEVFFAFLILFYGGWSMVADIIIPSPIKSFVLCGSLHVDN